MTFDDIADGRWDPLWRRSTVFPYDPEDYPDMREVDWQEMLNPNEGDKG